MGVKDFQQIVCFYSLIQSAFINKNLQTYFVMQTHLYFNILLKKSKKIGEKLKFYKK